MAAVVVGLVGVLVWSWVGCSASSDDAVDDPPELVVLGDSFASGHGLDGAPSFPQIVSELICRRVDVDAQDGTGYTTPPGHRPTYASYPVRARRVARSPASVVLVQGSDNDVGASTSAIETAAVEVYSTLSTASRPKTVVVLGPMEIPAKGVAALAPVRDALRVAASRAHVTFMDPLGGGWLTDHGEVQTDGAHPTLLGQHDIAERVVRELAAVGLGSRC